MWPAIIVKNFPMVPSSPGGTASRPPGFSTRASSAAAARWSGANMQPNTETHRVEALVRGSRSASPSTQFDLDPGLGGRCTACSSSRGVRSSPVTSAAVCAAGIVALPVPQATSDLVPAADLGGLDRGAAGVGDPLRDLRVLSARPHLPGLLLLLARSTSGISPPHSGDRIRPQPLIDRQRPLSAESASPRGRVDRHRRELTRRGDDQPAGGRSRGSRRPPGRGSGCGARRRSPHRVEGAAESEEAEADRAEPLPQLREGEHRVQPER